ncbi:hypothetical protein BGX27_008413 [Mortierella sp. AM989]|nr:hypothetical protein BGX27_008413 [Mortierella sp. AM989]
MTALPMVTATTTIIILMTRAQRLHLIRAKAIRLNGGRKLAEPRPCQRCVKRDLAATCADGVRKKAKYLQDAYDAQQLAAGQSGQNSQSGTNTDLSGMDQQLLSDQDQQQRQGAGNMEGSLTDANSLFNFPMTSDYGFGSETVNLEYSIISTMLSSPTAELTPMSDLSIVENWQRQGSLDAMASLANNNQLQKALAAQGAAAAAAAAAAVAAAGGGGGAGVGSGAGAGTSNVAGALANGGGSSAHNNNNNGNATNNTSSGLLGSGTQPVNTTNATSSFQHPNAARVSKRKFPSNTPENVYANTKQPFNYTDGFHYLLRYVRERMDKEEMMRICRAMAMFRPSFIALIMNLTPEDLIFMEKCFQRTILEFEKLISFSGTPTVVWRRTGEIALVGKEFSLLTQWGRDQLVGKKTYIYELMDNQSAVEYWEKFSTHAFENTEQTPISPLLLNMNGTIGNWVKRDMGPYVPLSWASEQRVYEWKPNFTEDTVPHNPDLEAELFSEENRINSGINFKNYAAINVSVKDAPPGMKKLDSFEESGMHPIILENVYRMRYKEPTPIQKHAIPIISKGYDLMACAQTGSGKTAAFLVPIISTLITKIFQGRIQTKRRQPGQGFLKASPLYLIILPTRELAIQIFEEARRFTYRTPLRPVVIYGGSDAKIQKEQMSKGCDILIATTGRLQDVMERGLVSLAHVRHVVLDEADRMLDMGFEPQIRKIISNSDLPRDESLQVLMFSATFPNDIQVLARDFLKDDCSRLRVGRTQAERELSLKAFKEGKSPILIATAVASRGLDIKDVMHIINYDLPMDIDEYVHRIGRTARAGNRGVATSFYNDYSSPIAPKLTKLLIECDQVVPDFLSGYMNSNATYEPGDFYDEDAEEQNADHQNRVDERQERGQGGGWGETEYGSPKVNKGTDSWGYAYELEVFYGEDAEE